MTSVGPAQTVRRLRCAACGADFDCAADTGACWCMALRPLPMPEADAGDCLCPACLGERIAAAAEPKWGA